MKNIYIYIYIYRRGLCRNLTPINFVLESYHVVFYLKLLTNLPEPNHLPVLLRKNFPKRSSRLTAVLEVFPFPTGHLLATCLLPSASIFGWQLSVYLTIKLNNLYFVFFKFIGLTYKKKVTSFCFICVTQ